MPPLSNQIVELLQQNADALRINDISKAIGIRSESEEYDALKATLLQLQKDNVIFRSSRRRYGLKAISTGGKMTGVLTIHHGRGQVETASNDFPTVYIKEKNLGTGFHGDMVEVQLLALKKDKKPYGAVLRVIERSDAQIGGTIDYDGDFYFMIPDDTKYYVDFLVHKRKLNGAAAGDKVLAKFVRWEDPHKSPEAEVVSVLGKAGSSKVEFDTILHEFSLPTAFSDTVEAQAAERAATKLTAELKRRLDLRKAVTITIDPDDARDYDDALSLERLDNGNFRLGVHIADVTFYVLEGTELDAEAQKRGNSTYLVNRVVPMLPEVLSNDVCSLVPNKPRLAFSVMMEVTPKGTMVGYTIEESVIKSKRRFTYGEVQQIIETGVGDYHEVVIQLNTLARNLCKQRYLQGGIDFETREIRFRLDENQKPVEAVVKTRTDATSLVEECMLLANQTVAQHVEALETEANLPGKLPFMYRVHDEPDNEKLTNALAFIRSLGIRTTVHKYRSKDLNALISQVEHLPEKFVIHQMLLRAMAKAVYSSHSTGHFGLGFTHYSHFTSPIRRYPDLLIHRLLKEYKNGIPDKARMRTLRTVSEELSDHCSITERASTEAERASTKLAQALMCADKVGEEFSGTVSGVTNFGLFVLLDTIYAEGLLHIRDINDDYYFFDEKNYRLVGSKRKQVFRIGSKLMIKITKVNTEKREIDLQYTGLFAEIQQD